MTTKKDVFYSKVLLFGEYAVLFKGDALSIPYTHYMGELSFINENKYTDLDYAKFSNKKLLQYGLYLDEMAASGKMIFDLRLDRLRKDIDSGLYFESSIPQGYGMGSSGALVAAIFSKYAELPSGTVLDLDKDQLINMRKEFSLMESYFHGTSSGLDPLLCYLKTPVLIQGMGSIKKVDVPRKKNPSMGAIFLLDTGIPEKTDGLVMLFHDLYRTPSFKREVDEKYIPASNRCIEHLIKENDRTFFEELAMLSAFQLYRMKPMIPEGWSEIWKEGLNSGKYFLKLLGSGGGGFVLGFSDDFDAVKDRFGSMGKHPILVSR